MRRTVLLLSLVGAMIMMYAGTVLATHIPPDLKFVYHEGPVKVQTGKTWVYYYGAITNGGGKTAEIPAGTVVAKHTVVGAAAIDYCYAPSGYTCNDTGNGTFEIVSQGANTIGIGQSLSFELSATAPTTDGKMTHSVTIDPNGAIGELDEDNNTSGPIATYVGTPPPTDLSVTQTDNEDPTYIGGWLEYTVKVTNNGQDTAFNVSVDNQLPDDVTYRSGCNHIASENVAICSMGNIPSGESKEVAIAVAPKAAGTISNTATVFSDSDPDSSNDTDKEDTVVKTEPVYEEPLPDDGGGGTTIIEPTPPETTTPPDTTRPTVSSMSPRPSSTTRDRTPTIKATVRDGQSNLVKGNVKLYVDGRRVTTFSYSASTDRLSYTTKSLSYARHTAKIVATDAAGNSVTKTWSFKVAR